MKGFLSIVIVFGMLTVLIQTQNSKNVIYEGLYEIKNEINLHQKINKVTYEHEMNFEKQVKENDLPLKDKARIINICLYLDYDYVGFLNEDYSLYGENIILTNCVNFLRIIDGKVSVGLNADFIEPVLSFRKVGFGFIDEINGVTVRTIIPEGVSYERPIIN